MLTYLDSNMLVQAATGANRAIQLRALAIITDPSRQFASSLFSRMEIIPLAIHFGRTKERLFYETFFRRVQVWIEEIPVTAVQRGDYIKDKPFKRGFQQWLTGVWQRKDQLLAEKR